MEAINLNLIPNGTNPVVHCSQYDEGREFRFNLFDGASVFVLDGTEDISCDIKKPDGNIVTAAVPNTEDDYIIVTTTLQMTACSGNSLGTINISKGDDNLYTLNFVLYCERSPLENGIESESSIHNLESMVDEMVAEEVATQYDSANVIFDNEPTDNHGIGYTVTSEGIKTAIDNAFDYDNTASGSLVHIEDGADNIPVKSLVSEIVAVETGNGQPKSPANPYTISGFDNGVIRQFGKNLYNKATITTGKFITNTGTELSNSVGTYSDFIAIKTGVPYYFSHIVGIGAFYSVAVYDENKTFIEVKNISGSYDASNTLTFDKGAYIRVNVNINYVDTCQIEFGTSATDYAPFVASNTYTFAFGQTVYGGYFDNKGNLVVTHKIVDFGDLGYYYSNNRFSSTDIPDVKNVSVWNSALTLCSCYDITEVQTWTQGNFIIGLYGKNIYVKDSRYTDTASFKQGLTGQKFVVELANPITLSITSQDIPTLLGENNIFSNCGDVEVNYYTNKSNDILEFVDSEIGKKNGTNIPIEANSQDSIKDYIDNEVSGINATNLPVSSSDTTSTKDYVDNGLNDKVAYKSGEVVYSNYVTGAYVSGSGNYVEFCIPINTKATSGTITNLGTTLNVFIGNTRLTNEVSLAGSSIVAIKDGYAQIELKLNSTQTANSVATVSLDGFTVNFA